VLLSTFPVGIPLITSGMGMHVVTMAPSQAKAPSFIKFQKEKVSSVFKFSSCHNKEHPQCKLLYTWWKQFRSKGIFRIKVMFPCVYCWNSAGWKGSHSLPTSWTA